jgi:hypothetical protein
MHSVVLGEQRDLKDTAYFRQRANQARQLSERVPQSEVRKMLLDRARDYDEIADNLERMTGDCRNAELLSQRQRPI